MDAPLLREAFAAAQDVTEDDVQIVDDSVDLLATPEERRVLLERTRPERAFPAQILAILRDPALDQRLGGFPPTLTAPRGHQRAASEKTTRAV